MSLIDEALRRARQEAARQDAVRRDERYRQVPVLPPMASRRRSGPSRPLLIAGIAGAVAVCALLIGLGMFLGRTAPVPREAAPEPVSAAVPQPSADAPARREAPTGEAAETPAVEAVPTPAAVPPAPAEAPPQASAAEPASPPSADASPASPPAVAAPPTPVPRPPTVVPESPTAVPGPPATVPAAPETAPEVRSFVRQAPLPDGGALRLNGIAFSSTQPVALIDDRVLTRGESYRGLIVSDIQPGFVELKGDGVTLRVSLK